MLIMKLPNGLRYPRVGGMRERHFIGINFKPRKLPENAPTPTSRVHAVLAGTVYARLLSMKLPRKSLHSYWVAGLYSS